MKMHPRFSLVIAAVAITTTLFPTSAFAVNQAWTGGNATNGNWSTGSNWSGGAAPNAANTATFNATITNGWGTAGTPIVLATDASITNITFNGTTGDYFLGNATSGGKFILTSGGSISISNNTTLTASNATITINAPLLIQNAAGTGSGTYNLVNNSENGTGAGTGTLNIVGAISGNATSGNTTTLTLKGNAVGIARTNPNTVSGVISDGAGGGTLSLAVGAGNTSSVWVLSGNNTFTGDVTLVSGGSTLAVSSDANLGLGGNITINQNSKLRTTASFATGKNIILAGQNPQINPDAGAVLTINGALTAANEVGLVSNPIRFAGLGTIVLNSGSNSFGSNSVIRLGDGGLSLGHAAALTGATLQINGAGNTKLDNTSGSALTLTNFKVLELTGGTAGSFTFTGSNDLDISSAQAGFTNNATTTRTITVTANTLTMSGILSTGTDAGNGTRTDGGLIKAGAGTLVLTTASDYTLGTTVNAGTLQIGNGSTTGSLSSTGAITNNATLAFNRSDTVTQGTDFGPVIAGTGNLVQNGSGNLILSGTNTYSGTTTVNGGGTGSVTINADSGLGTAPGSATPGSIILNNGGLVTTTTMTVHANRGIQLNGTGGEINVVSGTTTYNGIIAGSALRKSGSGSLSLGGTNSYTGATVISAGTLVLDSAGSIAASSGVNLGTAGSQGTLDVTAKSSFSFGAGQTVSGYGTINIGAGKVVTINGNLAPGNSPGIVNVIGDLTLAGTATMELAGTGGVAGTDFDQTTVSGALVWGGSISIVSFGGFTIDQNGSYNLFDFASQTGALTGVSVGGISLTYNAGLNVWEGTNGGGTYGYSFSLGNGVLNVSTIPEPSAWALAALGLTVTIIFRRRRTA